jgi:hypothetical protein
MIVGEPIARGDFWEYELKVVEKQYYILWIKIWKD